MTWITRFNQRAALPVVDVTLMSPDAVCTEGGYSACRGESRERGKTEATRLAKSVLSSVNASECAPP